MPCFAVWVQEVRWYFSNNEGLCCKKTTLGNDNQSKRRNSYCLFLLLIWSSFVHSCVSSCCNQLINKVLRRQHEKKVTMSRNSIMFFAKSNISGIAKQRWYMFPSTPVALSLYVHMLLSHNKSCKSNTKDNLSSKI